MGSNFSGVDSVFVFWLMLAFVSKLASLKYNEKKLFIRLIYAYWQGQLYSYMYAHELVATKFYKFMLLSMSPIFTFMLFICNLYNFFRCIIVDRNIHSHTCTDTQKSFMSSGEAKRNYRIHWNMFTTNAVTIKFDNCQ